MAENLNPVSLRFAPQFVERLERAAKAVGVAKHTLAQAAVTAVVEAIEKADGKVVMPIAFVAQSIPMPNPKAKRAPRTKRNS